MSQVTINLIGHDHNALLLASTTSMRKNAWTTQEEFNFLTSLIPKFFAFQSVRNIAPFYAETTKLFLEKFPTRQAEFELPEISLVRS